MRPCYDFNQIISRIMRNIVCTFRTVDNLISRYIDAGGTAIQLDKGCLQSGDWVLFDISGRLKCFYIFERHLNEWSSDQVIRQYSCWDNFPNKYKKMTKGHDA